MKVLIAVGGGGHFSAAISVIERMPKEWDILLVGRKHTFEGDSALSFEYQTAQRLGIPFASLTTGRLQRKFTKRTLISLAKMPVGFVQAQKIIREFKPDVVLSFGGYVSVPVVLAAAVKRLPIVIHEQVLHGGLANKFAARFATAVCVSWEESKKFFPEEKTVVTGNPLRKEFFLGTEAQNPRTSKKEGSLPVLYVTGGSGGAHGINVLIEGCLEKLLEKFTVIHQTGDAREFTDYDRLTKKKAQLQEIMQKRYVVRKFFDAEEVMHILSQADLIISRSGINTVTEILYLGKPSLLLPLPYGQHNEQLTNAHFVKKIGLAEIVHQQEVTPDMLFEKIEAMMSHMEVYTRHKEAARQVIHRDAAEKIVKEVKDAKEKRISA